MKRKRAGFRRLASTSALRGSSALRVFLLPALLAAALLTALARLLLLLARLLSAAALTGLLFLLPGFLLAAALLLPALIRICHDSSFFLLKVEERTITIALQALFLADAIFLLSNGRRLRLTCRRCVQHGR